MATRVRNFSAAAYAQEGFIFRVLLSLEELRQNADYNTGSISTSSAWALYSVTSLFQPRMVLEVGTFIGKSTMSMAIAMDDSGSRKVKFTHVI